MVIIRISTVWQPMKTCSKDIKECWAGIIAIDRATMDKMQESCDKSSQNSHESSVDTDSDGEGKAIHKPSVHTDSDVKGKVMSESHSNCDNSSSAASDGEPPLPNDYSKQLEAHRVAFNQKFFGT